MMFKTIAAIAFVLMGLSPVQAENGLYSLVCRAGKGAPELVPLVPTENPYPFLTGAKLTDQNLERVFERANSVKSRALKHLPDGGKIPAGVRIVESRMVRRFIANAAALPGAKAGDSKYAVDVKADFTLYRIRRGEQTSSVMLARVSAPRSAARYNTGPAKFALAAVIQSQKRLMMLDQDMIGLKRLPGPGVLEASFMKLFRAAFHSGAFRR